MKTTSLAAGPRRRPRSGRHGARRHNCRRRHRTWRGCRRRHRPHRPSQPATARMVGVDANVVAGLTVTGAGGRKVTVSTKGERPRTLTPAAAKLGGLPPAHARPGLHRHRGRHPRRHGCAPGRRGAGVRPDRVHHRSAGRGPAALEPPAGQGARSRDQLHRHRHAGRRHRQVQRRRDHDHRDHGRDRHGVGHRPGHPVHVHRHPPQSRQQRASHDAPR